MSVEAQGGKIWIENNQTGGTSVKFTVPITS
jgi:signal transduction histidine kinase